MMNKKKVVVIGGGFAGAYAAKKLEKDFELTFIDTKDYFEFTPGILRTIVEPAHIKKIQVLHRHHLHRSRILREEVKEVTENEVVLSTERIHFDYLSIMTGSRYNSPIKEKNIVSATRADLLHSYHNKIEKSKRILIIGGGLVGVELAAEITTHYNDKEVVIAQSRSKILERNTEKVIRYVEKFLKKKGVTIRYNCKITKLMNGAYLTAQGEKITADIAFMCVGIIPNSELLHKNFPSVITQRGYVTVNNNLQVSGFSHIFAAGDVADIKEEKLAQNAELQAKTVVENIYNLEKNKPLTSYESKPRIMDLSLGKWCGVLIYKNHALTGIIPGIIKNIIEWIEMKKYQ